MKIPMVLLAAFAAGFLLAGTGCSNKEVAERNSLLTQNGELKSQLDAERAARGAAEARASAATAQVAALPTEPVKPPGMEAGPLDLSAGSGLPSGKGGKAVASGAGQRSRQGEVLKEVLFDSGKATLNAAAKKALDQVAITIKKEYPSKVLRIEGHTDPTPVKGSGWDNNYDLAAARATAVLLYLKQKGIPEKNMQVVSYGASDPKSTKNLALDRRADIVVASASK